MTSTTELSGGITNAEKGKEPTRTLYRLVED